MNNNLSTIAPAASSVDNSAATMEGVLDNLARLGGRFSREDDIQFKGRQYVLPERQTLKQSVDFLAQRLADEEEEYRYQRTFSYLGWDGAVAVGTAMRELFGALVGKKIRTPFGDIPPSFVDVQVDVNEFVQAPWGRVALPWDPEESWINVGTTINDNGDEVFALTALTKRKYRDEVSGFFAYVERVLEERSIYRGKAITASGKPEFIDTSKVDPNDVIYTEQVMTELETHVWLNIRHPQALRDNNQSMKRLVVLHGTYGTGKTLAAYLTGLECVEQSKRIDERISQLPPDVQREAARASFRDRTTFVIVRPGIDSWERALSIARSYGKSCIFVEDVDTMIDLSSDKSIRNMLDQTDGLTAKGVELQIVWTTNHLERLPQGMLRPGRTDALIEIGFMDRPGVERLCRRVINTLAPDVDFDAVFEAMSGYTPAYVREALDRTVRYSLAANKGVLGQITTDDLVHAANGLRPQLEIMHAAPVKEKLPTLDATIRQILADSLDQDAIYGAVDSVVENRLDGSTLTSVSTGDSKLTLHTN